MTALPEIVSQAWEDREPIAVLTTVNPEGVPNSVYVGIVGRYDETTFFVANNYFSKTQENILACGKASLLFLTHERKSYQLKGAIELQHDGPIFDAMKNLNPAHFPGHSVAVLRVAEVYSGATRLA